MGERIVELRSTGTGPETRPHMTCGAAYLFWSHKAVQLL
jgi:hypothetical protein